MGFSWFTILATKSIGSFIVSMGLVHLFLVYGAWYMTLVFL